MPGFLRALVLLLFFAALSGAPAHAADVRFSVIKTAGMRVDEALVFSGGSFSKKIEMHFSAILVQHGDDRFLFDSGLGRNIAAQYRQDMPWWSRPFFRYEDPVVPAIDQLRAAGQPEVRRIVLSHAHWDHASGVEDFPGAEVWLASEELALVQHAAGHAGGAWPSQVQDKPVHWKAVSFDGPAYEGFERSHDLYGDGSVVLVPMPGHTAGSAGLFVKVSSGRRFFFVGDVVWNAGALQQGRPKFWAARWQVDGDVAQTQVAIERIRAAMARDPALVVVPAHDGAVQDGLAHLPRWVE